MFHQVSKPFKSYFLYLRDSFKFQFDLRCFIEQNSNIIWYVSPIVIPKLRSLAFSKPGTTAFSACESWLWSTVLSYKNRLKLGWYLGNFSNWHKSYFNWDTFLAMRNFSVPLCHNISATAFSACVSWLWSTVLP